MSKINQHVSSIRLTLYIISLVAGICILVLLVLMIVMVNAFGAFGSGSSDIGFPEIVLISIFTILGLILSSIGMKGIYKAIAFDMNNVRNKKIEEFKSYKNKPGKFLNEEV